MEDPEAPRILTIQKSPQRAINHLKTFGKFAGVAIFSATFYLLYWKDSSIRRQYETIFWWLALIGSAAVIWWNETSQARHHSKQGSPQRISYHLKALGKIASLIISSAIIDLVFLKDNRMAGQFETYLRCFTLIFAAAALWLLVRDWLVTGNRTFTFDGNNKTFSLREKDRDFFQLPFQAIKRIKIEMSSNLFPVYILSVHLQDGQVFEIDASANPQEMNILANRLSDLTGVKILFQRYDDPLSKEEKEEQHRLRDEIYKGD